MCVVLDVLGTVEVDHVLHPADVDTATWGGGGEAEGKGGGEAAGGIKRETEGRREKESERAKGFTR